MQQEQVYAIAFVAIWVCGVLYAFYDRSRDMDKYCNVNTVKPFACIAVGTIYAIAVPIVIGIVLAVILALFSTLLMAMGVDVQSIAEIVL